MEWTTLLGLAGVPISLGLTMAATTEGEFRFVRACLWGTAFLVIGNQLLLIWNNDRPLGLPEILVAAVIGAVTTAGLAVSLDWVKRKQHQARLLTAPSKPAGAGEFAGLTNQQLRNRVVALAQDMRQTEQREFSPFHVDLEFPKPDLSEQEKASKFVADMNATLARSNARNNLFANKYRSEIMALRSEMLERLAKAGVGKPKLNPLLGPDAEVLLESSMLAGPMPMSAIADYIEAIARTLP